MSNKTLGINLTKDVHGLYIEIYKTLLSKLKNTYINGGKYLVLGQNNSILIRG